MKKLVAFLMAVTTCFCAFTACGDTDDDSDKGNTTSDSASSKGGKDSENEVYLEAIQTLIDAAASEDIPATLRATLPDITMDAIENTDSMDAMIESMGDISNLGFEKDKKTEIVSVDECDADTLEKLEKLYSVYSNLFIVMDENDISYNDILSGNIDEDEAMLIMEPATQLSQIAQFDTLDVKMSVEFEDAKLVTFKYNDVEEEAVAYKVKGENWKIDTVGSEIIGY